MQSPLLALFAVSLWDKHVMCMCMAYTFET